MKTMHKIVIKVGSSTLTQGSHTLSKRYMLGLAQQIAILKTKGLQLVLVSSGAVATGRELFNTGKTPEIPSKQALASIGQIKLMQTWAELFSLLDLQVGQVLLTKEDFNHTKATVARDLLNGLMQHHIIPIINENDTIATHETCIGDNDNLTALIARLIAADTIILLTDQKGLYTADPRLNQEATLIPVVKSIDDTIFALAAGSSTSFGTGGMTTKIEAAQHASRAGIQTVIASSSLPNVLIDLAEGKQVGTLFLEEENAVSVHKIS